MDAAPPQQLIESMDGKVWLVHCAEKDVPTIKNQHLITNISPSGDPVLPACLRILSKQQPFASAVYQPILLWRTAMYICSVMNPILFSYKHEPAE